MDIGIDRYRSRYRHRYIISLVLLLPYHVSQDAWPSLKLHCLTSLGFLHASNLHWNPKMIFPRHPALQEQLPLTIKKISSRALHCVQDQGQCPLSDIQGSVHRLCTIPLIYALLSRTAYQLYFEDVSSYFVSMFYSNIFFLSETLQFKSHLLHFPFLFLTYLMNQVLMKLWTAQFVTYIAQSPSATSTRSWPHGWLKLFKSRQQHQRWGFMGSMNGKPQKRSWKHFLLSLKCNT